MRRQLFLWWILIPASVVDSLVPGVCRLEQMETGQDRVVALVDMDCFFVQVEQRQNPHLRNKPCAVVQYKSWKGGGIIAVSYEARAFGVTRNMWADDAKKLCPDLLLAQVRESREKLTLPSTEKPVLK